ncbi:hypothetical protein WJS89_10600 [Sphingomicrobium sp. XHP0235]|uniref:hypothetical protein n=1 Tax=Sphingomicrobium aquimarinum TaxID=3133971 RepID=UPI0031FE7123
MATSFIQVIDRWFNEYGSVLNGGKLYTYEAGTSTPLATYQDLSGSTPNTNPVILDAAGTATVRLSNGVAYKLVLKNSDDVTLDEADNVIVGTADSTVGEQLLVAMDFVGTPGAQATMRLAEFDRDVTFPADFEGSQASVATNPGASYVVEIQKNGASAGTVTFDTDGVPSFTSVSGATVAFTTGDVLKLVAPASVGTAADFTFLLVGDL